MCEYDPKCSKADDSLAMPLWRRRRDAEYLVLCPKKRHPLAAIFNLPTQGRVVVCPDYQMLRRSMLVDLRVGHELNDPNGLHHMHATVIPVSAYAPDERELGRCHCGTWTFSPATVTDRVFGRNYRGQPYTLADYVSPADAPDRNGI